VYRAESTDRFRQEPNGDFEQFTGFMQRLVAVPHSEIKAKLDAEKEARRTTRASGAAACHDACSGLATYVGFINLNRATIAHLKERSTAKGETDAMHHESSRLLRDAKGAAYFIRADAVLGSRNHPDGGKPLLKEFRTEILGKEA
jgi:hypothetical protein